MHEALLLTARVIGHQPGLLGVVEQVGIGGVPAGVHRAAERQLPDGLQRLRVVQVPRRLDTAHEDSASIGVERLHAGVLVLQPGRVIVG